MNHKQDSILNQNDIFIARGKGACDDIGATVKREATRASLQANPNEAILSTESLFQWAKKTSSDILFFYYGKKDHKITKKLLSKRFVDAPSVTNIQKAHAFLTFIPCGILTIMRYSNTFFY